MKKVILLILSLFLTQSIFAEESFIISDVSGKSQTSTIVTIDRNEVHFSKCNANNLEKCIDIGSTSLSDLENLIERNNQSVGTNRFVVAASATSIIAGLVLAIAGEPQALTLSTGGSLCALTWVAVKMIDPHTKRMGTLNVLNNVLGEGREQCRLGLSDGKFNVESYRDFEANLEYVLE